MSMRCICMCFWVCVCFYCVWWRSTNTQVAVFKLDPVRCRVGHCWGFISLSACLDTDECQMGTHRCGVGQICHNLPGSYRCDCQTGYQYDALHKACTGTYRCVRSVRWWRADRRFSGPNSLWSQSRSGSRKWAQLNVSAEPKKQSFCAKCDGRYD